MSDDRAVQPVEELGGDDLLALYARLAQEVGLEMGLTLFVRGQAISGMLISRDKWLDLLTNSARTGTGTGTSDFADAMLEVFRQRDLNLPAGQPITYGYIHLRNAQILNTLRVDGGFLWRGRISEISGWALGKS